MLHGLHSSTASQQPMFPGSSVSLTTKDLQVDVRALKQELWHCLGTAAAAGAADEQPARPSSPVSFQQLLSRIPLGTAAGRPEDLSVHLCFICLLHLANEHGLAVRGVPSLDQLYVADLPPGLGRSQQ